MSSSGDQQSAATAAAEEPSSSDTDLLEIPDQLTAGGGEAGAHLDDAYGLGADGAMQSLQSFISEIQEELEQIAIAADDDLRAETRRASRSSAASAEKTASQGDAALGDDDGEVDEDTHPDEQFVDALSVVSPAAGAQDVDPQPPDADDYLHNPDWLGQSDHVFVLSTSGKPIYTLHGNEDKLATIFGVMQALVSVVESNNGGDQIQSVQAGGGMQIVFLVKRHLILVAVSKSRVSIQQLQMELSDVYNQILSTLTLTSMTRILETRKNFDLRRLLAGSERLINNLVLHRTQRTGSTQKISNKPFVFLTNSVRILPLSSAIRDSITSAIQQSCAKIKDLVFAVLLANGKLITMVRMKKYSLHPADLRLMFNLIECSESFKTAESWTPICLPKFDPNGFMYAHVSYLADDCQACLLLLSVEQDVFFTLSEAKKKITEKLRRTQCLKAINDAMLRTINLRSIGLPEMRHFLYKSKSNAQLLCSEISTPYSASPAQFARLERLYYHIHDRIHSANRPVKLIFEASDRELQLGWLTTGYELYVTFEPLISKTAVIKQINALLTWIKKEEDSLFILSTPTF